MNAQRDSGASGAAGGWRGWVRFDRNELAGSFGDIGTDLPLIVGIVAATGAESGGVFVMFGLLQILTGLVYGVPMPMQPLKAMAVLVITQKLDAGVLHGGGLAIGVIMLGLSLTGGLERIAAVVPRCVVRGLQFGLGLSLGSLALRTYLPAEGVPGYWLAGVAAVIVWALRENRRFPAALFVIALGAGYVLCFKQGAPTMAASLGPGWPVWRVPGWDEIWTGLVVLALPQLPLSLGNSVIATRQTLQDLFPQRAVSVRRIGVTYGLTNVVASLFGGVPVCHGCGGLAGHHAFGARTGGSVVLYGLMYCALGVVFGASSSTLVEIFPKPVLAVILAFESLALLMFLRDEAASARHLSIALTVALCAAFLPNGYLIGMVLGIALYHLQRKTDPR